MYPQIDQILLLTKFPQETNLICGNYFFNLKHANRKPGINAHAFNPSSQKLNAGR